MYWPRRRAHHAYYRRRVHDRINNISGSTDQGGSHRGPDGSALVRGDRQRQRSQDGDWRHQRQGRFAGAARRSAPRGQRDERCRRGSQSHEARRAGSRGCDPRRHLQLHAAGDQGSGGRQGQDAVHLPGAVRGTGMRSAHLLHRPGAGAAGRSVHSLADAADGREEVLPAVSGLHLAAHDEQESSRGRDGQRRRDRRRGVLSARSRRLRQDGRRYRSQRCGGGLQHDRSPRSHAVSRAAAHLRLHASAAGTSSAPTSTRTS